MKATTLRAALAGLGLIGALVAAAPGATAATYPVPVAPATLPAAVEDLAPYVAQDSCDPTAKPGAADLAQLLTATYPDTSIIGEAYACGTDGNVSEHYEGRAVDWAIDAADSQQVGEAHALLAWLFGNDAAGVPAGNARRLGVMYAIYDARIIGTYDLADGWRAYACSGVTGCHENHVHLSLSWAGAAAATSWWSGAVAPTDYGPCVPDGYSEAPTVVGRPVNPTPCPAHADPPTLPAGTSPALMTLRSWSGATFGSGSRGPAVAALQTVLGVPADASFGAATLAALQAFQGSHSLPLSGVTDLATWTALLGSPPVVAAPVPTAAARPPTFLGAADPASREHRHLGSTGPGTPPRPRDRRLRAEHGQCGAQIPAVAQAARRWRRGSKNLEGPRPLARLALGAPARSTLGQRASRRPARGATMDGVPRD